MPLYISALFCPPYYAMSFAGTGRLENVVYFTYIVLTVIAIIYFTGWLYRKTSSFKLWEKLTGVSRLTVIISVCAFIALTIGSRSSAYWAAKSIKQGKETIFVVSSNMIIEGQNA